MRVSRQGRISRLRQGYVEARRGDRGANFAKGVKNEGQLGDLTLQATGWRASLFHVVILQGTSYYTL
jgi:hypothetical protein